MWPSGVQLAIDRATGNDITVALLVKETPGWANANAGVTKAPTSAQAYADFLTAARRKYPAVNRWMIWGETNRAAVWDSGPVRYADLVDSAYAALKAPDGLDAGTNTVVAGMTFTFGETAPAYWIEQLKRTNGARPRFDEYGHNPFARRCPIWPRGRITCGTGRATSPTSTRCARTSTPPSAPTSRSGCPSSPCRRTGRTGPLTGS